MNNQFSLQHPNELNYPYPLYLISYYDQLIKWNIKPTYHECNGKNYCKTCYDFFLNYNTIKIKHPCTKDSSCNKCYNYYVKK
jgi:hypothetical protein